MPGLITCLLLHLLATAALFGLIWTVQLAIYPRFADFPAAGFPSYHFRYCRGIGLVVAPLIVLELLSGLVWWLLMPSNPAAQIGMGLIVVNLFSTAFLQAPLHVKLMQGRNAETIKRLVLTNWIRTATWTIRTALVGTALAGAIS